jgi:hypothetical protein
MIFSLKYGALTIAVYDYTAFTEETYCFGDGCAFRGTCGTIAIRPSFFASTWKMLLFTWRAKVPNCGRIRALDRSGE